MRRSMKKQLFSILTLLIVAATILVGGVAAHIPQIATSRGSATNAAFRDGMFMARYDIEQGRKLHLSSGRWSSDADRASFIAGYNQVLHENHPELLAELTTTEVAAYRDGVNDGVSHRKSAQPFQAERNETYRHANREQRQAYSTGYQLGYYTQQDVTSSPVLQTATQIA